MKWIFPFVSVVTGCQFWFTSMNLSELICSNCFLHCCLFIKFNQSCQVLSSEVVIWCVNQLRRLICHHPIFDSKQSRDLICYLFSSLTTVGFTSMEESRLFLYLDFDGGTNQLGMFPHFMNRTADVVNTHLSVILYQAIKPACDWLMSS